MILVDREPSAVIQNNAEQEVEARERYRTLVSVSPPGNDPDVPAVLERHAAVVFGLVADALRGLFLALGDAHLFEVDVSV